MAETILQHAVSPCPIDSAVARKSRVRQLEIKIVYLTGFDVPDLLLELFEPSLRKPIADETSLEVGLQAEPRCGD